MRSLKTFVTSLFILLALTVAASAQLTGTKNIPGDYATLAAAITDLNTQGVGAGGVTFNLIAGNPQTAPAGGYVIGGTGSAVLTSSSAANPIAFTGNSNTITASSAHTIGNLNDALIKLIGADWVTVQGFNLQENALNTTIGASNNMTEWGIALLYVTSTDGAQNNSLLSNIIDLNRTYGNTFGIYSNSTHTATAVTTSASATGAAGSNTGLKIQNNGISDSNFGIVVVGPTAAADQQDQVDIGGPAPALGNQLSDIGTTSTFSGYANVSGTVNGILVRNVKNYNISFNDVSMSNGGVAGTGTINGIHIPASSNAPTGTLTQSIDNNAISVRGGNAANTLNGINIPTGSLNSTTINSINGNNFHTFGHTVSGGTGGIFFVVQSGNPLTQNMNSNTFTNINVNTTGIVNFFVFAPSLISGATFNLNGNSISGSFTRTGVGSTTVWNTTASSVAGSNHSIQSNNFSNITLTGASPFLGISDTDGPTAGGPQKVIAFNTFSNITTGAGNISPITMNFSGLGSAVNFNTISNITTSGNITAVVLGGSGAGSQSIQGNTIHTINSAGTTVTGISAASFSATISRNKIYDLNGSATGSVVTGIAHTGANTNTTFAIVNNLIGNLTAPASTSSNGIIGLSISGAAATSNFNVFYNTVYLNNPTSGAGFGSSGIRIVASSTSTISTLSLRNNIIVNTSVQNGSGLTVAYRRDVGTGGTLVNYSNSSNNNLFYAGTPGPSNLIYSDGVSTAQTLAQYKAGVFTAGTISPRDSSSVSENPPFLSTTGASANFLHISAVTPTQVESGGAAIAGFTDDFDGNVRHATNPDIGADEGAFTVLDATGPAIAYTPLGNTTLNTNRMLTVNISDATAVAAGALRPRLYFRKSTSSFWSTTQCTMTSGTVQNGTYDCLIDYALVEFGEVGTGDILQYYVAAQDTTGNVSANPSAGFSATNVNTVTTPPTTPSSYTIVTGFPVLVTVGTGGTYPSLTNNGGLFEAMNASVINANVTIQIVSDMTGETGTHALNQMTEEGAGAGTYTVTIVPTGAPRSISGVSGASLIKLNGADRVTIDGSTSVGTDRSLTINNASAGAVIWIATNATGGANNNTIKNTILAGNGGFTGQGIMMGSGTAFGGAAEFPNSNNTIQNNQILRVQNALFSNGNGTMLDQNLVIADNTMGSAVTADKLAFRGIFVANANVVTITRNQVSGVSSSTGTSSTMSGILIAGNIANVTITRNEIKDIRQNSTNGWGSNGIYLAATNSANVLVANNFVSDIASQGFNGNEPSDNGYGIVIENTGGGYQIYHNTVVMNANQITTNGMSAALLIDDSAGGTVDLRNNILANTATVGVNYSVFVDVPVTSTVFTTINRNDYFSSENVGNIGGTIRATLGDWQTGSGQDLNSLAVDPLFVSPTDLHLGSGSPVVTSGQLLAAVNIDQDNDLRDSIPDIGADERTDTGRSGVIPAGTYRNGLPSGSSLGGNVTFTGSVLIGGVVTTGANTLTIGCTGTAAPQLSSWVDGNLRKEFCAPGSFTYPVGQGAYSPVTATVTAVGTVPSSLTVTPYDSTLSGFNPAQSLSRNWALIEQGDITANLQFVYDDTDVNGNENDYRVYSRAGLGTGGVVTNHCPGGPCVIAGSNVSTVIMGITSFSRWTMAQALSPTAATVDVSGRVMTADGRPIRNVQVAINGEGLSEPIFVYTGNLGYYNFEGLPAGRSYVLSVNSKRFAFSNPIRLITPQDNLSDQDFVAETQP